MRIVWGISVVVVVAGLAVWKYQSAGITPTGMQGIWAGQLLDANEKAVANVECTISPMKDFTGMIMPVEGPGTLVSKSESMHGRVDSEGRVEGGINITSSTMKSFYGTTIHAQNRIEGNIVIKSQESDKEVVPLKIRLQRK